MQTKISDLEGAGDDQVLSQFTNVFIQDFLAMVGLLKQRPDQVRRTLNELTKSEQFNMAILFLYGLAFNSDEENISDISTAVGGPLAQRGELQQILLEAVGVSSQI